jgi:hypothetical protein
MSDVVFNHVVRVIVVAPMTLFLMMPLGPWLLGATEHNIISNKTLIVNKKVSTKLTLSFSLK